VVAFVWFGRLWSTLKKLLRPIAFSQVLQKWHETLSTLELSTTRKASKEISDSMMQQRNTSKG